MIRILSIFFLVTLYGFAAVDVGSFTQSRRPQNGDPSGSIIARRYIQYSQTNSTGTGILNLYVAENTANAQKWQKINHRDYRNVQLGQYTQNPGPVTFSSTNSVHTLFLYVGTTPTNAVLAATVRTHGYYSAQVNYHPESLTVSYIELPDLLISFDRATGVAIEQDPTKEPDADGDGIPDVDDADDDNDGIPDVQDPDHPDYGKTDTDGDGRPDDVDTDDDNDGIPDATDDDDDGDGTPDLTDPDHPDYSPPDQDGDGIPDDVDNDDDGDGFPDRADPDHPDFGTTPPDLDGDGQNNDVDDDDDGDGTPDPQDNDDDGDGIPDESDPNPGVPALPGQDSDGDGTPDIQDPDHRNPSDPVNNDTDGDGAPDHSDSDDDGDGIPDNADRFPTVPNPNGIGGSAGGSGTDPDGGSVSFAPMTSELPDPRTNKAIFPSLSSLNERLGGSPTTGDVGRITSKLNSLKDASTALSGKFKSLGTSFELGPISGDLNNVQVTLPTGSVNVPLPLDHPRIPDFRNACLFALYAMAWFALMRFLKI